VPSSTSDEPLARQTLRLSITLIKARAADWAGLDDKELHPQRQHVDRPRPRSVVADTRVSGSGERLLAQLRPSVGNDLAVTHGGRCTKAPARHGRKSPTESAPAGLTKTFPLAREVDLRFCNAAATCRVGTIIVGSGSIRAHCSSLVSDGYRRVRRAIPTVNHTVDEVAQPRRRFSNTF
jgi:hypothetical protein